MRPIFLPSSFPVLHSNLRWDALSPLKAAASCKEINSCNRRSPYVRLGAFYHNKSQIVTIVTSTTCHYFCGWSLSRATLMWQLLPSPAMVPLA